MYNAETININKLNPVFSELNEDILELVDKEIDKVLNKNTYLNISEYLEKHKELDIEILLEFTGNKSKLLLFKKDTTLVCITNDEITQPLDILDIGNRLTELHTESFKIVTPLDDDLTFHFHTGDNTKLITYSYDMTDCKKGRKGSLVLCDLDLDGENLDVENLVSLCSNTLYNIDCSLIIMEKGTHAVLEDIPIYETKKYGVI